MKRNRLIKATAIAASASIALAFASCGAIYSTPAGTSETQTETEAAETTAATATTTTTESSETTEETESTQKPVITEGDITINGEIDNSSDSEHAVEVSGETEEYSKVKITKTGDSDSGDQADFYGDNAAVFATDGATLTLTNVVVSTDGTHANGVFSYGEGTTVNISDSVITTDGNCSGGLMTTGGGTMNASNLNIHTTGNSSAAIRSDRGGGTVNVTGGQYVTEGRGSPAVYSTADITVSDAVLQSTVSEGIVVEGRNSVTLNNVTLIADNNQKNSDKSSVYKAVMIYQSMSGDAKEGRASFTMTGGSITNANGDVFYVNNTVTTIVLEDVEIINQDQDGVFLRAEAAGWGSEGSNGGKVDLYLTNQTLEGDIAVDDISYLNMYLTSGTTYEGAINADNEGTIYVEIGKGSKWTLTGDSYITSLTCDADAIDLNGHTLYINGVAYTQGSAQTGEAVEFPVSSSGSGGHSGGEPGEPPDGGGSHGGSGDDGGHSKPPSGDGSHGEHGDPPPKP